MTRLIQGLAIVNGTIKSMTFVCFYLFQASPFSHLLILLLALFLLNSFIHLAIDLIFHAVIAQVGGIIQSKDNQ